MTYHSTFGVNRIRFVDGTLSREDDERFDDEVEQLIGCVEAGFIRALLDTTHDLSDLEAEIAATDWHSPAEGWERQAVVTNDWSRYVLPFVTAFVRENLENVITFARMIAWDTSLYVEKRWQWNEGMAFHRVGMLLAYQVTDKAAGLRRYGTNGIVDDLVNWCDRVSPRVETFIDSSEEPCLLHVTIHSSDVKACPHCGDEHNVSDCAAEGATACSCCAAIEKADPFT